MPQSAVKSSALKLAKSNLAPLLELKQISKQFPGVLALDNVDFDLHAGEVHVLFGENGAGKSTLISIVAGATTSTSGELYFKGAPQALHSVHDARKLGIGAVFQELSLVPQLTVGENLTLGAEVTRLGLLDKNAMATQARQALEGLGFDLPIDKEVRHLSRAEQQMVEIASAFLTDLSVLILDEPTASLTERETENLFRLLEQATEEGVGVIYITHRMSEIKRIGDRITVLRDGKYVTTIDAATANENQLLELMTGRVIDQVFPAIHFQPTQALLSVANLTAKGGAVRDVSFEVRRGEIVGFAGLVGSGKSRAARTSSGIGEIESGQVLFEGRDVTGLSLKQMLDRGLFYVPPDRRREGLVTVRPVRENITLASVGLSRLSRALFLRRREENRIAQELSAQLNLQPLDVERDVYLFSGGNQQKVLLAKTLTREVKLFIFDEPTVGVDVGTRVAIYRFMAELCESGAAVLLVSSDLPEILYLTNRVYVFHRGQIRAQLQGQDITEEKVLGHFFSEEKQHD